MKSTEELTRQLDELKQALLKRELNTHEVEEIEAELERLEHIISPAEGKRRSLRGLKGVGKELWRSIDVDAYLREERRSWR